jgi:hypothetical protein
VGLQEDLGPCGGHPMFVRPVDVPVTTGDVSATKRTHIAAIVAKRQRARRARLLALGAAFSLAKETWAASVCCVRSQANLCLPNAGGQPPQDYMCACLCMCVLMYLCSGLHVRVCVCMFVCLCAYLYVFDSVISQQ